MNHWLFKSEPSTFSFAKLEEQGKKGTPWDGIRSFAARNNMRDMKVGDRGFFYHSNEGLDIVGVVEVCAPAHPDPTSDDPRWECVDIRAVEAVPTPVPLSAIKANPKLADMALVVNSRLSVQPVTEAEWAEVCRMAGLKG